MESNELRKVGIKGRTFYHLDDLVKIEDLRFENILLDEK